MSRRSILARVAVGLAVFFGAGTAGVGAAAAVDCLPVVGCAVNEALEDVVGEDESSTPPPSDEPAEPTETTTPPETTEPPPSPVPTDPPQTTTPPPTTDTDGGSAAGPTAGSGGTGGTGGNTLEPGSGGQAPGSVAPQPPAAAPSGDAPAVGNAPASGNTASGSSTTSTGSTARSTAPASLAPETAVPLAPQGPVLTSVEATAATTAIREVRESLPASVQPNTRLLAEETASQGIPVPSPNDDGLLALIVAMGAASIGCAIAALALRPRPTPRHIAFN